MSVEITPERWQYTLDYLEEVFGAEDDGLRQLRADSVVLGLPPIAVSPDIGKLLSILVSMTGAKRAIEVGTLGGYSAIWIARGLAPGGKLYTIERNAKFADFAEGHFAAIPGGERIELRRGQALDVLATLSAELGPSSVDVVFLDADKREYERYFEVARRLIAPGGLLIADNVLGTNTFWIDHAANELRVAVDRFNRRLAADAGFDCAGLAAREGLLIARRRPLSG